MSYRTASCCNGRMAIGAGIAKRLAAVELASCDVIVQALVEPMLSRMTTLPSVTGAVRPVMLIADEQEKRIVFEVARLVGFQLFVFEASAVGEITLLRNSAPVMF